MPFIPKSVNNFFQRFRRGGKATTTTSTDTADSSTQHRRSGGGQGQQLSSNATNSSEINENEPTASNPTTTTTHQKQRLQRRQQPQETLHQSQQTRDQLLGIGGKGELAESRQAAEAAAETRVELGGACSRGRHRYSGRLGREKQNGTTNGINNGREQKGGTNKTRKNTDDKKQQSTVMIPSASNTASAAVPSTASPEAAGGTGGANTKWFSFPKYLKGISSGSGSDSGGKRMKLKEGAVAGKAVIVNVLPLFEPNPTEYACFSHSPPDQALHDYNRRRRRDFVKALHKPNALDKLVRLEKEQLLQGSPNVQQPAASSFRIKSKSKDKTRKRRENQPSEEAGHQASTNIIS